MAAAIRVRKGIGFSAAADSRIRGGPAQREYKGWLTPVPLEPGQGAIFVADFDAKSGQVRGRPRRVTEHVAGESLAPAWSPDGTSLALVSVRTLTGLPQRGTLVILRGVKTIVHPLDFGVARGTGPAWSADGKSLFLPGSDPGSTTENVERLYRVDAITGKSAAVPIAHVVNTKLRVGRSFPVLTRDGRLAYVSRAGELFRVDVATGEREGQGIYRWAEREVLYSLALSPDGRRLAFGPPRRDATPGLAVMPATGGTPEMVHAGEGVNLRGFGGISWEPDGRHLLVVSGDEVMRFSLDDRRLSSTGLKVPGLSLPSLNPSATRIVYQVSRPKVELWSVDLQPLLKARHP